MEQVACHPCIKTGWRRPWKSGEGAMERVMGIEPTLEAWEAAVLPLNYTRSGVVLSAKAEAEAAIIARLFLSAGVAFLPVPAASRYMN